ncbi:hypothetical protein BI49514_02039 [Brevibacterium iodinum ATCC 49514]|uniref:ABC-2 family transporter protein n=1 Tax=Brevibacterium iodinum ATCC 49514 TaxID=1255616 RepID=A0A2H1JIW8_9MICO|nr:ABC transporter permease [Brevibacterium iodinum]SMX87341.1 hypothetical protein BI49514_02039 [Brevibacterium iodinum ATCC 49514]SUW14391.1 YhgE/Pip C-terminal domain [Brevibacterium iodinum]
MNPPTAEAPTTQPTNRLPITPEAKKKVIGLTATVALMLFFVLGMIVSYSEGFAHPSPNNLKLAIAGNSDSLSSLQESADEDDYDFVIENSESAAKHSVEDRDADAAIFVPDDAKKDKVQVYVVTGASPTIAKSVEHLGDELASGLNAESEVHELGEPSPNNPNASMEFYLVVFLTIGGGLGATAFGAVLGRVKSPSGFIAYSVAMTAYAVLLAGAASYYATQVISGITGEVGWELFAALWLYVMALGGFVTGLVSVTHPAAGAVTSIVLVMLGNTASGGPFGLHMMNGFFQGLSRIMPQTWGLELIRDIEYFDSNGMSRPVIALIIFGVAGIAFALGALLLNVARGSGNTAATNLSPSTAEQTGSEPTFDRSQPPRVSAAVGSQPPGSTPTTYPTGSATQGYPTGVYPGWAPMGFAPQAGVGVQPTQYGSQQAHYGSQFPPAYYVPMGTQGQPMPYMPVTGSAPMPVYYPQQQTPQSADHRPTGKDDGSDAEPNNGPDPAGASHPSDSAVNTEGQNDRPSDQPTETTSDRPGDSTQSS